ncbi:diguanylate cyclase (GGDEF)-like protein [Pseudomonas fluvialis]|uniref:Diguanylate cyclase (GGDEF)-like protein n=1 Tax=Pseudomonas fluvialis TaxID=1793966 RepID=A0A7X0BTP1_9PSED|nr:EAL domain-containing protein [Pseudomonas fluvialis]MBB6342699.1 diguanylate cyclase (GGDEF)-like protein [Pseudomonas fluvialis]
MIAPESPSSAGNPLQVLQHHRLGQLLKILLVAMSLIGLSNVYFGNWLTLALIGLAGGLLFSSYRLLQRGRSDEAAALMLWTLTSLVSLIMWVDLGLRDSGLLAYPGFLVFAAILASRRTFFALLAFMLANVSLLALGNLQGWHVNRLPPVRIGTWIDIICILSVIASAVWLLAGDLRRALLRLGEENQRVRQSQAQIEFLAQHDALTQLPNRVLARARCDQALIQARRDGGGAALLFLDLDNFKTLNDSLGHGAGDRLLQHVAEQLRCGTRSGDTVCRQSGDEFLVVLGDIADADAVAAIATQLLELLALPLDIEGIEVSATCSLGIALYPVDGEDFDTLLKKADIAMYRAKDSGRNNFRFYDAQMNTSVLEHLQLITAMRLGFSRGEFSLHYQAQYDLRSGRVIGAEALLRWQHPQLGQVSPAVFIPLAEKSGLIIELGAWVLQQACAQAAQWHAEGLSLVMAVNLSPLQMRRHDIDQVVVQALQNSGLPAELLELEMTESMLIDDSNGLTEMLGRLRALGITLAIDDFGTGYSNLAYLKRFDVEALKIDQSFVRRLCEDSQDEAIVRAIIQMAASLNLHTVAEGIEDAATLQRLRELGCTRGQGFYWAPALPAARFAERVRAPLAAAVPQS